jgi:hypothetical protein
MGFTGKEALAYTPALIQPCLVGLLEVGLTLPETAQTHHPPLRLWVSKELRALLSTQELKVALPDLTWLSATAPQSVRCHMSTTEAEKCQSPLSRHGVC